MNITLYHLLMTNPLTVCAIIFLSLGALSLWFFKKPYCFLIFILGACFFAYLTHALPLKGLISFLVLGLLNFFMPKEGPLLVRAILFTAIALLSFGLILHIVPGSNLLHIVKGITLSKESPAFDLSLSMNETMVGLLPLAFSIPLIRNRFQCQFVWKKTVLITVCLLLIFFVAGCFWHLFTYKPKVPFFSLSFLFSNLFLSVIPQEAFFRGFLQRQFSLFFSKNSYKIISVLFSSIIFILIQIITHDMNIAFLSISFIAALLLGLLYFITESIESVILAHFTLNIVHFFFFTYPYTTLIS